MKGRICRAGLVIFGLTGLFIFNGCSVNPVNSSLEEIARQEPVLNAGTDLQPVELSGGADLNIVTITFSSTKIHQRIIDSVGGTIAIPILNDTSYFVVPPGAVNKKKNVGVSVIQGFNLAGEKLTQYVFTPFGFELNVISVLEHKVSCQAGNRVELWWDNPNDLSASFEMSQVTAAQNQQCRFPIGELSTFVVWEANLPPAQNQESLPPNKLTQSKYIHYK
ncbi:MAG: hypothetical protein L0Y74_04485 [candidate division Zixibacteria bacterium]|nr:hypothetical protein [candidate division Zixibacteria bacterium]